MQEEHREPWEILGIMASGYLGILLWHSLLTVMEYGMLIVNYREEFNLGDCLQVPLLV